MLLFKRDSTPKGSFPLPLAAAVKRKHTLLEGGILEFAEKKACAHLCIVARSMMFPFWDSEAVAEIVKFVASESVDASGRRKRTFPSQLRKVDAVELCGMLQTAPVERNVMGHKCVELVEIAPFDLLPDLRKIGGVLGVLRTDAVNLYIPVVIAVIQRPDEPRLRFGDLAVANHAYPDFANRRPLRRCGFKVNGDKVYPISHLSKAWISQSFKENGMASRRRLELLRCRVKPRTTSEVVSDEMSNDA